MLARFKEECLKVTVLSFDEVTAIDFTPPATFFIVNALGDYIFVHTRDRSAAQAYIDEEYGKGKYAVKASKLQQAKGDLSVRGTQTRRGQKRY